ncbi:MAG: chemotaxis protein CheW [Desulfuromonadales bacterium]
MKLVFRVGEIGFSLLVEHLVEVIHLGADEIHSTSMDGGDPEFGTFLYHGESVALVDLRQTFGLDASHMPGEMPVLMMSGEQGLWAAVVETVEGVYPESSFRTRDLPLSLICTGQKLYSQLDIWRGEPLVCLEPFKVDRHRIAGCL